MGSSLSIEGGTPVIREPLPTIKNSSGRLIGDEEMRLAPEHVDLIARAILKVAGALKR